MAYTHATKSLAQRLGLKTQGKGTSRSRPATDIADFKLECGLTSLDAAQKPRRQITKVGEVVVNWGACGAYTLDCTLLPLDVARERMEISHRAFF